MTIIGKSKAALAMICDAITSQRGIWPNIKILNNLKVDGEFRFAGLQIEEIDDLEGDAYVLGGVTPKTKLKLVELFPLKYAIVINESSYISRQANIGDGCIVDSNVSLSNNVTLNKYVTVYANTVVSHDSTIGDFVTLCPNVVVCGGVKIGTGTFVGANTVIKNDITIGNNCTIGAGSVVIKDVADGLTVSGNPAHIKL